MGSSSDTEGGSVLDRQIVLLVDDNETHQYSLGKHLEDSGFVVLHADSGSAALDMAGSYLPHAVLLDINLPDMTGFEVCEKLKKDSRTKAIPIIFHSATHDTQLAKVRAMDLGASSFLSYPISFDHLLRVLQGAFVKTDQDRLL